MLQYNNCGLVCKGSEDIVSERSENRYFQRFHSHLTPPFQRTPANIRIQLIFLETRQETGGQRQGICPLPSEKKIDKHFNIFSGK